MRTISSAIIFIVLAGYSQAATWEVRQNGLGDFLSINQALVASASGDEIFVWPGTYLEPEMVIDHDVNLTSTFGAGLTILDGQGTFRIFHVTAGASTVIDGFTLQDAIASDGAAIHVDNGSQAILVGCDLRDNNATYVGGAGYVRHTSSVLTFESCTLENNFAPLNAGAVGVSLNSTCNFYDCTIVGNTSNTYSGAIANFANSTMNIEGCLFYNNVGGESGAIRIYSSPAVIKNNTFFSNVSDFGTIFIDSYFPVVLDHNIIFGDKSGYGVFAVEPQISECNIFYGNSLGHAYGVAFSPEDFFGDPLFCYLGDGQFELCADSYALPVSNSCGLIGAAGMGCEACGAVGVETHSWGDVKAQFR